MAGRSSLNPNAEPYIPLSKRENSEQDSKNDDDDFFQLDEYLLLQSETAYSSIQKVMNWFEANTEEDIEILKTMFPDILEQSLSDAYFSNDGNMDKTIDMFKELQISGKESSSSVPKAEASTSKSSTKSQ